MGDIKVSIIIPYFDNVVGISRLLNSIDDFEGVEIIVINDHSDSIIGLIEKIGNPRLRYFEQVEGRRWAGAARNLGLQYAKGEYLLFADSDDSFCSDWYGHVSKYFELDYDLIYFSPDAVVDGGGSKPVRHLGYKELISFFLELPTDLIRYRFHVPWSKLIRRSLVVECGIQFDEVVASNDVMFSLKVGYFAKTIQVDSSSIYCVTESADSLTKQISEDVLDSRFEVISRYNDFLITHDKEDYMAAMSGHLKNSLRFGFYKFFYRFFYCKYKGYPIFYSIRHVLAVLKRELIAK